MEGFENGDEKIYCPFHQRFSVDDRQKRVKKGLRYSAKRNETKRNEKLFIIHARVHYCTKNYSLSLNTVSLDTLFRKIPIPVDWQSTNQGSPTISVSALPSKIILFDKANASLQKTREICPLILLGDDLLFLLFPAILQYHEHYIQQNNLILFHVVG